MKLDLEGIGMCLNKSLDKNIHMIEKMTQTDLFPMSSTLVSYLTFQKDDNFFPTELERNSQWNESLQSSLSILPGDKLQQTF